MKTGTVGYKAQAHVYGVKGHGNTTRCQTDLGMEMINLQINFDTIIE